MSDLTGPAERAAAHQRILNARPIPPRHRQHTGRRPIPVTARLVWQHDGVELVDTIAVDLVDRDVLVEVQDQRSPVQGVWVDAGGVRRR